VETQLTLGVAAGQAGKQGGHLTGSAASADVSPRRIEPLDGFTIGITAARRRDELESLLERRGARVFSAPAIRIVALHDDGELIAATRACLAAPLDLVVANTGIGFRGWLEAADGWGLADRLHAQLREASIVTRGPKARGAVRAAGLVDSWSPESESSQEMLDHLLDLGLAGTRIAVQLHGEPQHRFCGALRAAGADVVEVPVYRWVLADDVGPLRRLVDMVVAGQVDAVAFTSAPAAASMLRFAAGEGQEAGLVSALRQPVIAACVGPVCAAPLHEHDIPTLIPERARLGALVRAIAEELPSRRTLRLELGSRQLEVRGHGVAYDGRLVNLAPGPLAVLKALAARPGRVLSRKELLGVLPGDGSDEHAVEMTVARLRTALGDSDAVQTVVKRGYRLACDPTRVAG
jgi:uroporphyrinogen-III synthase